VRDLFFEIVFALGVLVLFSGAFREPAPVPGLPDVAMERITASPEAVADAVPVTEPIPSPAMPRG